MAQQPQRPVIARPAFTLGWRWLFIVIAVVLFVIDVFVQLGDVSAKWQGALIPGGLAFFAAAHL